MHELSLMSQLMQSLDKHASNNQLKQVTQITLEVGKMRAVVPAFMQDAFLQLSKNTLFEGAALEILEIDVDIACRECGKHIGQEDSLLAGCPFCGSHRIKSLSGNELRISSISGIS